MANTEQIKKPKGFQKGHKDFVTPEGRKRQGEKLKAHLHKKNYFQKGNVPHFILKNKPHPKLGKGGQKHTEETKIRMSATKQGLSPEEWERFVTPLNFQIRALPQYEAWRSAVYQRDGYKCVWCGTTDSGVFNADHITPLSLIIKQKNIGSIQEAIACKELWDICNGRTLCKQCHYKTETYGIKSQTYA